MMAMTVLDRLLHPGIERARRLMKIDDARTTSTPDDPDPDLRRLASRPAHHGSALAGRIASPPHIVSLVWTITCLVTPTDPRTRLICLTVGLICLVAGPSLTLAVLLRSGSVSDEQVVRRTERHRLYILILAWIGAGALALTGLGAPRQLLAVAAAMLTGVVLVAITTLATKASLHLAVLAGAAVVLCLVWWPAGALCAAAVPLLAWARVDEGRHTRLQVLLGTALGALGGASYLLYNID
ncbi:hypothetical protein C0Z11_09035 [Acidipropionibacterium jensenii]|nr:hypothetical protein C0Z11_09035 [Acidipropionibacterium jensenii]